MSKNVKLSKLSKNVENCQIVEKCRKMSKKGRKPVWGGTYKGGTGIVLFLFPIFELPFRKIYIAKKVSPS